eukprot:g839.t1
MKRLFVAGLMVFAALAVAKAGDPDSFHSMASTTINNLRSTNAKSHETVSKLRVEKQAAARKAYDDAMRVANEELKEAAAKSSTLFIKEKVQATASYDRDVARLRKEAATASAAAAAADAAKTPATTQGAKPKSAATTEAQALAHKNAAIIAASKVKSEALAAAEQEVKATTAQAHSLSQQSQANCNKIGASLQDEFNALVRQINRAASADLKQEVLELQKNFMASERVQQVKKTVEECQKKAATQMAVALEKAQQEAARVHAQVVHKYNNQVEKAEAKYDAVVASSTVATLQPSTTSSTKTVAAKLLKGMKESEKKKESTLKTATLVKDNLQKQAEQAFKDAQAAALDEFDAQAKIIQESFSSSERTITKDRNLLDRVSQQIKASAQANAKADGVPKEAIEKIKKIRDETTSTAKLRTRVTKLIMRMDAIYSSA